MSEVAAAVEEPAEQTSDSLINISTEPEVVKEETPAHLVDENEVTVDEPVEEQKAERPEWLEERFWNEEKGETDVEKLGRSYKDLRKKMAEGSHKVPKEYDMGALESLDQEDPALKKAREDEAWAIKAAEEEAAAAVKAAAQAEEEARFLQRGHSRRRGKTERQEGRSEKGCRRPASWRHRL